MQVHDRKMSQKCQVYGLPYGQHSNCAHAPTDCTLRRMLMYHLHTGASCNSDRYQVVVSQCKTCQQTTQPCAADSSHPYPHLTCELPLLPPRPPPPSWALPKGTSKGHKSGTAGAWININNTESHPHLQPLLRRIIPCYAHLAQGLTMSSALPALALGEIPADSGPVNCCEEVFNVVSTLRAVLEVIGVLPDIYTQGWECSLHPSLGGSWQRTHQWVVLVGRGCHYQPSSCGNRGWQQQQQKQQQQSEGWMNAARYAQWLRLVIRVK